MDLFGGIKHCCHLYSPVVEKEILSLTIPIEEILTMGTGDKITYAFLVDAFVMVTWGEIPKIR